MAASECGHYWCTRQATSPGPRAKRDRAALAVEFVHAYSLVHDDMPCMDNDVLRRGKPTVHVEFDEATAMLAGDALQAEAFKVVAEAALPAPQTAALIPSLRTLFDCRDVWRSGNRSGCSWNNPTIAELERMHRMKTGALLKAAVLMGALSGRVALTECTREALAQYGEAIGLAFQIVDDLLDVEASTAELGKTAGKDAEQRKPTYVSLLGAQAARAWSLRLRAQALQARNRKQRAAASRIGRLYRLPEKLICHMELLSAINSPSDLRALERSQLPQLADELRAFVLESVSKTGGHLSSNLGTVELTIALHYVFDTPEDRIVWDVGHQTYPHKILTGRDHMAQLRQYGGMSGFPRRSESEYDTFHRALVDVNIGRVGDGGGCSQPRLVTSRSRRDRRRRDERGYGVRSTEQRRRYRQRASARRAQ